MREALSDRELLGDVIAGDSWARWRVSLIAANGEELTEDERVLFREISGREREPGERVEQFVAVVGRRGGKDRAMSVAGAYFGGLCSYDDVLVPGERGLLLVLAENTKQAGVAFGYLKGIFERVPKLKRMVVAVTADTIELNTGVDIQIRAASFRGLRGPTCVMVIADEIAFWLSENTSNPDSEILGAVEPSLATTGGMLALISSPYAKRGALYDVYAKHFGPDGDPRILVVQGASRMFNPTLSERVVARAYEKDPEKASAEYGGLFRSDLEDFVSRELVEGLIERGVTKREPIDGVLYHGFVDPSGGSKDSMTGAIAHLEGRKLVLDAAMEIKAPFSPEAATARLATDLFLPYGVRRVRGDRYAGQWPSERMMAHGIEYMPAEFTRSEIYIAVLPEMNSGHVALLDDPRIVTQFAGLERRTSRTGRDSIDHKPGAHDDLANAIAGALLLAKPAAIQEVPMCSPGSVPNEAHYSPGLGWMEPMTLGRFS